MNRRFHSLRRRPAPQPAIGVVISAVALGCLGMVWAPSLVHGSRTPDLATALLAASLLAAAIVSHAVPIHIRHNTKINVGSVPLYLLTVLLPPAPAAALVGGAVLIDGLIFRAQRGNHPSDIATEAGRWTLLALAASSVGHLPVLRFTLDALPLLCAGGVLWAGDILTAPLVLSPMSGESPRAILLTMTREAGPSEAAQYLVGLMGALVAGHGLWTLALLLVPTLVVHVSSRNAKELPDRTRQLLEELADWVDLRDPYTGGHSRRVAELSAGILQEMCMRGPEVDLIVQAARLHDIGKITLPDQVLNKRGSLTPEEEALVRDHPALGAEILMRYPSFGRGIEMILCHHERWDGAGYPYGLRGSRIPLGARIIAVADSFDAMTTDRPYRRALGLEQAAAILREGRGRQWDPAIVDVFLRSITDRIEEPAMSVAPDRPPLVSVAPA